MMIQSVRFPARGDGPVLEGILQMPDEESSFPAAVLCHPHPMMGGTMDVPLLTALEDELAARRWATLRFNFRGVGRSQGRFDEGRGEQSDVAGAVDFFVGHPTVEKKHLAVAGYSFGAEMGLRYAAQDPDIAWLVGIALVQACCYGDPFLDEDRRPKLFVAGEQDPWGPGPALQAYVDRLSPPKDLWLVPGADHFFFGEEETVTRRVGEWLDSQAPQPGG